MGPSYDAQRNEFCAYVLHESQTPYGLLLGNLKTFAQSTAKGGVRGLWDADTDQIIFGMHHIAYRLRTPDKPPQTLFPHQYRARAHVLAVRANLRVHARPTACTSPKRFTFRTARRFRRAVRFVVDVTLYNPGREDVDVAVFPWAMLVGQRFYGEPEHEVRAWSDGRFICSKNLETGGERWWGGSRKPKPSSFRYANKRCSNRCAARASIAIARSRRRSRTSRPNKPSWSAAASSARSSTRCASHPVRANRYAWRSCTTRTAGSTAARCSNRCSTTRACCTIRNATSPNVWPTRAL